MSLETYIAISVPLVDDVGACEVFLLVSMLDELYHSALVTQHGLIEHVFVGEFAEHRI